MRMLAFADGPGQASCVVAVIWSLTLRCAGTPPRSPSSAPIRGTVVDPQGARGSRGGRSRSPTKPPACPARSKPMRRAATRPPTSSRAPTGSRSSRTNFKKFERPGVLVRASGDRARGHHARARQRERDGDRDPPRRSTTSRSTARRSRAASTSSSSATCRATAATSSPSCSSTRTSSAAAATRHPVPGRARPTACSYIQDGQASTNAIFGTVGNSAPGPRRGRGDPGAVELVQRRVRRARRRRRDDEARQQQLPRHRASTTSTATA